MTWNSPRSFPRAILHVDGDGFFAACEVAKDPSLRGKPVITGKERGIVSACTYEAKARGVKRGMILSDVRKVCPDAVILPSDYETYSLFSQRMYEVVRRFTPAVEEYSIDECFADLTPTLKNGMMLRRLLNPKRTAISLRDSSFTLRSDGSIKNAIFSTGQAGLLAAEIKKTLEVELGMTFSLGLSATKVLAKVGSKWQKPSGLIVIPLPDAPRFLAKMPTDKIWGIGHNTSAYLHKFGIHTALDLAKKDETWVREKVSKPFVEIWKELNGEVALELDTEGRETYQSIQKTKTFTPPSRDADFVFSQLSKNIENACIKARRWGLSTPEIFFFLKTQDFKYHGYELKLPHPTAIPQDVLALVKEYFPSVFRKNTLYRATGITLMKLSARHKAQLDLFGKVEKSEGIKKVFDSIDEMSERYGKHAVFLGSSFTAITHSGHAGDRGELPTRTEMRNLFKGETFRRRLNMPFLGEVS